MIELLSIGRTVIAGRNWAFLANQRLEIEPRRGLRTRQDYQQLLIAHTDRSPAFVTARIEGTRLLPQFAVDLLGGSGGTIRDASVRRVRLLADLQDGSADRLRVETAQER